ncbi:MAG TPA: LarC family nickel insertion protein [Candidatus Paenibacillus intestinavium]|nr:LarC family nickel insertion protein [Candidatus Paenibacillus intestinavium]
MENIHPPSHEHVDDQMYKLEVNLDDIPGEWLGYVMDLLLNSGANDVYYTPIFMKKNRPGTLLQLLCAIDKLEAMKDILFRETTTLGIRYYPLTVHRLERAYEQVETQWGTINVKKGFHNGQLVQWAPEYEDCRAIAASFHIPLKEVYAAARRHDSRLELK